MDLGLGDKTALVMGGSKGIGYGCAEALAAEGCDLSICARHEDELEDAAEEQGITKDEAVQRFLDEHRPHIEVGRPGTIDEVGRVVAFLASEHASFVNGSDYRIDGGAVAAV
jgi:NAD(P)-dependent dehydrogenase (short-subunit alcohol dehydrogenase family)